MMPKTKWTFGKWIDNFWYYYKWFFLCALVFVLLIAICVYQFAAKRDADLTLLYIGHATLSDPDCKKVIDAAESTVTDVNGDGDVTVDFKTIVYAQTDADLPQGQRERATEIVRRIQNELIGGDSQVLLVDRSVFSALSGSGALFNLYGVYQTLPASSIDDYGIPIRATRLSDLVGSTALPADTILCMRAPSADLSPEPADLADTIAALKLFIGDLS